MAPKRELVNKLQQKKEEAEEMLGRMMRVEFNGEESEADQQRAQGARDIYSK